MNKNHRYPPLGTLMLAGATALAIGLTGCAGGGAEAEVAEGKGVEFGASMEEYHAAFADVEPISLRIQTADPQGAPGNAGFEKFGAALEEWSDGKITVEWGYANSFVPAATEWNIGLGDGRIDIGLFLPYYNPDIFPELTTLSSATFLEGNAPTATLVSSGWLTDALHSIPVYKEEAEASGVHILGQAPSVSFAGIFCAEERASLEDFAGVAVSASGTGRVAQLTALGLTPQSIAFTELYEALERNIVGCGSTTITAIDSIGAVELIPHGIADPVGGLVGFPNIVAMSKDKFDSLPLVAQQLVSDRFDILLENEAPGQGARVSKWLESAQAAGGGLSPLDDDAREALLAANDVLLEDMAASGTDVDALQEIFDKWASRINDDLYPDVTDDLEEFLSVTGYNDLDYQPLIDALYEEVLNEQRPN